MCSPWPVVCLHTLALASSASSAVPTTISTSDGESMEVDGTTYPAGGVLFDWVKGSSHTIATTTPQYRLGESGGQDGAGNKVHFHRLERRRGAIAQHSRQYAGQDLHGQLHDEEPVDDCRRPRGRRNCLPADGLYKPGTAVTIHAIANPGSTFSGWSGDCSGTGDCKLTMDYPHFVQADFTTP